MPSMATSNMIFTPKNKFATNVATIITIGNRSFLESCFFSKSIATLSNRAVAPHCIPLSTRRTYSLEATRS